MRFYTVVLQAAPLPAVSFDGGRSLYSMRELGFPDEDLTAFIRRSTPEGMAALAAAGRSGCAAPLQLSAAKLCAPIPHPAQDVICLGINYREHAVEAGQFSEAAFGGERPCTIYFSKRVTLATADRDTIPAYEGLVDSLDYEAELGVILGRDAKAVPEAEALDCVFGYTIINDVSARNLQTRHKQWYLGKSLDGFTPMGPCIVTPDELGDAARLNISSTVNGQLRQSSNTRYMIQTVQGAIAELSQGMTLQAGTILAMGTPAGVGMGFTPPRFLKRGDTVVCKIEKIGALANTVE